jgi:hypothetical protein
MYVSFMSNNATFGGLVSQPSVKLTVPILCVTEEWMENSVMNSENIFQN